ncbi:MAG: arsenic efflux protein [Bacilli bacterium]|nr:arsenic efflux protein [Bacilli bacterium]
MIDLLLDAFLDSVHLIPFLLVTFLLLELIEHKFKNKSKKTLTKSKRFGPIVGALLGAFPQCGFSAVVSNLFSSRVVTMGTVIAVFLSTSDEMLPMMIAEKSNIKELSLILISKVIIGMIIGLIVDLIINKSQEKEHVHELCEHDHCDCENHGVIVSSIIHTLKITLFIFVANLFVGFIIETIGEEKLQEILLNKNIFKYFIASLVGLIPNCSSSVILTQVYLDGLVTLGTLLSGLLTGSGIGILILFKQNKNLKENMTILGVIYIVGVVIGIIADLLI